MSIPTFTTGYPPDGSSLGQTKATIRNNLDGTFLTLAVDHINNNGSPGAKPAGYHKVIHSVPQASNPAPVAGYGQLFCKTVNSFTNDQALFWETGAGIVQQLTTNITPTANTNGYTFLPGGLILQWGFRSVTSGAWPSNTNTALNFTAQVPANVNFQSNCFAVWTTNSGTGTSQGQVEIASKSTTGFVWRFTGSSSATENGFFWWAIGN